MDPTLEYIEVTSHFHNIFNMQDIMLWFSSSVFVE